ncbi:MAG: hypothetical protein ABSH15_00115 [Verrucomicrobiota bacterium]|jgi:hypothetical protein
MNPRTEAFVINLAAGFALLLIVFLYNRCIKVIRRCAKSPRIREILKDQRITIFLQLFLLILVTALALILLGSKLSKISELVLLATTLISCIFVLTRELMRFWSFGINTVEPSIAADTYAKALNASQTSFFLLGTNAHSYCALSAFEEMLKRIRQSSGQVELLLAHPDSNALVEAARNRDCEEHLYQTQARIALGRILLLKKKLGIKIEIYLYKADNIEDLPIFRAMFVNASYCIASIAVYGREDHGRAMPQMHVRHNANATDSQRSMYSVLYRYYRGVKDRSPPLSVAEEASFVSCAEKAEPIVTAFNAAKS